MPAVPPRLNAVISLSDPEGVEILARSLARLGAVIYASEPAFARLTATGSDVRPLPDLTGAAPSSPRQAQFYTPDPCIYAGLTARRDDLRQMAELAERGWQTIDVLAADLTPHKGAHPADIRSPVIFEVHASLLGAAASNYDSVVVLSGPDDYRRAGGEWNEHGDVSLQTRSELARKALERVADFYEARAASTTHREQAGSPAPGTGSQQLGERLLLNLTLVSELRYGENPHQAAAMYSVDVPVREGTLVDAVRWQGSAGLSYNNLLDASAALAVVCDYTMPAVAIARHGQPCAVACGSDQGEMGDVFGLALNADPVAAFGGVVALNREVDEELASHLAKARFGIVIAPGFSPGAEDLLGRKEGPVLLAVPHPDPEGSTPSSALTLDLRAVSGGYLVQTRDSGSEAPRMEPVTLRHPTLEELSDLLFAWRAVRHILSNGIVLARRLATVGIAGGQPSRAESLRIAARRAGEYARGSVLASDGYFAFPDCIKQAADAGITAIIQPGGSANDDAIIEAADIAGMAMLFTGERHYKH